MSFIDCFHLYACTPRYKDDTGTRTDTKNEFGLLGLRRFPPSSRPKRLTLRGYKQFWFTFKDTSISYYKSKEESLKEPIQLMNLRGNGFKHY